MSKRMFNKMYTKNDVLKIYLESLGALQILVAVQSLLLCPRDSSLCRKMGAFHLDITGKGSVDSRSLSALQSWFILM